MTLAGRVAVVTGAGRGIGKATALALAHSGADVAAVDVDEAAVEATAAAVTALGRKGLALVADVGEVASIDGMAGRVVEAFGRIDILVNNAGVTRRAHIMDLTEDDWDRIMRVNGKGGVLLPAAGRARDDLPRERASSTSPRLPARGTRARRMPSMPRARAP